MGKPQYHFAQIGLYAEEILEDDELSNDRKLEALGDILEQIDILKDAVSLKRNLVVLLEQR